MHAVLSPIALQKRNFMYTVLIVSKAQRGEVTCLSHTAVRPGIPRIQGKRVWQYPSPTSFLSTDPHFYCLSTSFQTKHT